jgi:hypothetical protein
MIHVGTLSERKGAEASKAAGTASSRKMTRDRLLVRGNPNQTEPNRTKQHQINNKT